MTSPNTLKADWFERKKTLNAEDSFKTPNGKGSAFAGNDSLCNDSDEDRSPSPEVRKPLTAMIDGMGAGGVTAPLHTSNCNLVAAGN